MTDIRTAETAELPTVATVSVNGVPRAWAEDLTVAALVVELAGDAVGTPDPAASAAAPTGVAVALDGAVVPRGLWGSTPVPAGAQVEVVTAVQGG